MDQESEPFGPKTLNEIFYEKAEAAFKELFEAAKAKNELQFAFSLTPEFRGSQGPGWNTAIETQRAFDEYHKFIQQGGNTPIQVRVALGFYSHISEASGFYEIPKNMLRVADGHQYNLWPFMHLVKTHADSGARIAPNSNKVVKDLVGHSDSIGLHSLAEVFRDAFDSDLRNGYAHADYVLWQDGIHLPRRNGGYPKVIEWIEFNQIFERGINFYLILRSVVDEYVKSYNPAKRVRAALNPGEPEFLWTIEYDPKQSSFSISTGHE